jgi:hypothetical protein
MAAPSNQVIPLLFEPCRHSDFAGAVHSAHTA